MVLKLDTRLSALEAPNLAHFLDSAAPMSPGVQSPFFASPIVASTLLLAAKKIAPISPLSESAASAAIVHPVPVANEEDLAKFQIEPKTNTSLYLGQLKPIAVAAYQDLLFLVRTAKWKVAASKGQPFSRNEQLPYFGRFDEAHVACLFTNLVDEIWPAEKAKERDKAAVRAQELVDKLLAPDSSITDIIGTLQKGFELACKAIDCFGGGQYATFDMSADAKSVFMLDIRHAPERLIVHWPASLGQTLLTAISEAAQQLRNREHDPNFVDYLVFHVGYDLLRQGAQLDTKGARWLGTVGFRKDTQTYVSLTDPGEGHLFGTTRKARWLRGAICHVEHLERPGNLSRQDIESYRIPSLLEFARVRLHTGAAAPNTYFVGRRAKDSASGEFGLDFIKIVNLTSAACSAAFQLGSAETKVAMDGLTAKEAVAYMRALSGHTLRNHKQIMSAAFNLNAPFVDDLAEPDAQGNLPLISEQMSIGRRGIQLASMGGFTKVTFDGAADSYPSFCVILQLTFQNALELVHLAHEAGLTTYFSAGFKFAHIADAVLSGVDGIGIGGAQILRYMDNVSGHHGPYTEEFIDRIDAERDEAATSIRGKGVHLLCRLDRMHFEGSLTREEENLRPQLYAALYNIDKAEIIRLLELLRAVTNLPDDGENPTLGMASRLIRPNTDPLLHSGGGSEVDKKWAGFKRDLKGLLEQGDEEAAASYYISQPWSMFREVYIKERPEIREDNYLTVKATPYANLGASNSNN